jgi:hypothetical protein
MIIAQPGLEIAFVAFYVFVIFGVGFGVTHVIIKASQH